MSLTEEDIRKMSPEQLRELQKQQCIFCHIISKRVQSRTIYEDEKVAAILDINPANPGHVLLMPKEHYSVSPQLPDDLVAHMAMIAKQMSQAILRALGAQGTTVMAANGVAAGQRASHFMLHIIPRREGDRVGIALPPGELTEHQVAELQQALAPVVAKAFGKEAVVVEKAMREGKAAGEATGQAARKEGTQENTRAAPEQNRTERQDNGKTAAPDGEKTTKSTEAPTEKDGIGEPPAAAEDEEADAPEDEGAPQGANLDDITSLLLGGKR